MEKERAEYFRYIEYLQANGFFKNEPEYLQLKELQGVQGLKAIRLEVNLETAPGDKAAEMDILGIAGKSED